MSIEMHVLFSGKLPSKTALARTMKELGFPLAIGADVGSLEMHRGYMPMRLRREETGVEFNTFNNRADVEEIAGEYFDLRFERSAGFRWGGDETEMLTGMCSAAALAKIVDGMVLDCESGELMTPDEAVVLARRYLDPYLAKAEPSGTRPADLKRYLKPLLELRSDLVLVGRMLLVRPVRHLLRGAYFDRTSDKYRLRVYQFVHPLCCYQSPYAYGGELQVVTEEVWQPHFPPLLIDSLAHNLFSWAGNVTTLDDFAALPFSTGWFYDTQVITRFLMGGWEHAADHVRKAEQDDGIPPHIKKSLLRQLNELPREVEQVCARLHAREAGTAAALKLDGIWEPSSFPIELPPGERAKVAEPFFLIDPWMPRPASLLAEAPERSGEIRYAKQWFRREGRLVLAAVLTPEAARERHRAHEQYTLLVRLPDGLLVMINRNRGDRNAPDRLNGPYKSLRVELHARTHCAAAEFRELGFGLFELWSLFIHELSTHNSVWSCHINAALYQKRIHSKTSSETSLTFAECRLVICRLPAFGEYAGLAGRVRSLLQILGYGSLA